MNLVSKEDWDQKGYGFHLGWQMYDLMGKARDWTYDEIQSSWTRMENLVEERTWIFSQARDRVLHRWRWDIIGDVLC